MNNKTLIIFILVLFQCRVEQTTEWTQYSKSLTLFYGDMLDIIIIVIR